MKKVFMVLSGMLWLSFSSAQIDTNLVYSDTLDNGLQVLIYTDSSLQTAATHLAFKSGGRYDRGDQLGVAYFCHQLLQNESVVSSASKVPGPNFNPLTNGYLNDDIDADLSTYQQFFLPAFLENALKIEAIKLDKRRYTNEYLNGWRTMIRAIEETKSTDKAQWFESLSQFLFWPPNHQLITGTLDLLESTTNDEIRAYLKTYYTADRAVLSIVSPLPKDSVQFMVRKYFSYWPTTSTEEAEVVTPIDSLPVMSKDTTFATNLPLPIIMLSRHFDLLRDTGLMEQFQIFNRVFTPHGGLAYEWLKKKNMAPQKVVLDTERADSNLYFKAIIMVKPHLDIDSFLLHLDSTLVQFQDTSFLNKQDFMADVGKPIRSMEKGNMDRAAWLAKVLVNKQVYDNLYTSFDHQTNPIFWGSKHQMMRLLPRFFNDEHWHLLVLRPLKGS